MDVDALIQEVNCYFDGDLRLEVSNGRLGITVGARTLFVSLPTVVGARTAPSDQRLVTGPAESGSVHAPRGKRRGAESLA